jgi:signal peptidase I
MRKNIKIFWRNFWRGWGLSLLIAILLATSFKSAIADWNDVPTGSMIPTIMIGDRIFVNKLAYDLKIPYTTCHMAQWDDPGRGDIVVFYSPRDGKRLVKRVIGIPGDSVAMWKNRLIINGTPVTYEPVSQGPDHLAEIEKNKPVLLAEEMLPGCAHEVMFTPSRFSLHSFGPITVPRNHYFMMGDNRDNSADSRFFGSVHREEIVGRALSVAASRDKSWLTPRWHRFFQPLR